MSIKFKVDEIGPEEPRQNIRLTSREKDVLLALVKGLTANEIAKELHISSYTVSDHRKQMLSKFKAKNSCHLVYLACMSGHIYK